MLKLKSKKILIDLNKYMAMNVSQRIQSDEVIKEYLENINDTFGRRNRKRDGFKITKKCK